MPPPRRHRPLPSPASAAPLRVADVTRAWLPLAASWLLMGLEGPLLTMAVARLPEEQSQLGAWSLVFAVSLVIEGPVIMLLAASIALCTDRASYARVRGFMLGSGALLTAVHVAIAFTPLFDWLVRDLLEAPEAVIEPARLGLRIMTPWTWAIGWRRFCQGLLIRNGQSGAVGKGTLVRLVANGAVLLLGVQTGAASGIVVGATAVAVGVVAEALYAAWRAAPVIREQILPVEPAGEPLGRSAFLRYYLPLALTPFVTLVLQPLGAHAMGRLPMATASLATFAAVHGLVFMTRSLGFAFNEVVVSLVDRPGGLEALRSFRRRLALGTTGVLTVLVATPLSDIWFEHISDMSPMLSRLATAGVAVCVLMPAYQAWQSFDQGILVKFGATRAVSESVVVYALVAAGLLALSIGLSEAAPGSYRVYGRDLSTLPGLLPTLASFVVAGLCQTAWMRWRSAPARAAYAEKYATPTELA